MWTAPKFTAGIAGIANAGRTNPVNGQMQQYQIGGIFQSAAGWATIWFALCVLIILAAYFGFGGLKGDVAS